MRAFTTASLFIATTTLVGCQQFSDLQDLELARGEAEWLPAELAATFGLALSEGQNYSERTTEHLVDAEAGWEPSPTDCGSVVVADALGADGRGVVQYAYGGCEAQAGVVTVSQEISLTIPENVPPQDLSDELLIADTSVTIEYSGYENGLLESSGEMTLTEEGDVGGLSIGMEVGALDYRGALEVDGDWSEMADGLASRTSVVGGFQSATGVTWTVVADNLLFSGCMEPTGGELQMIFDNGLGRVRVDATFDSVCDGCAQLSIDGEPKGETCFGDGQTIGGFGQMGAN